MIKKIAGVTFGLALIIAPAFALAESGDVQAKIAALLAQIKELQALILQLQNQTSVQSNCVDLSSNLTLGSSGDDVTSLQNYLINSGLLDAQYNTGYYGFITAKAVGKLQMNLDVVSSQNDLAFGIMGPKSRAAVACNGTTPPPPPPSPVNVPVQLNINSQVTAAGNGAWVTVTIAGNQQNKNVNLWKLQISCSGGITMPDGKGGGENCGKTFQQTTANMADPTKDYVWLTAGATNDSKNSGNVVFALSAYDANGNNIGGDKEIVVLAGTVPSTLAATCEGKPYSPVGYAGGASWHVNASGGSGAYTYQWMVLNDGMVTGEGGKQSSSMMVLYNSSGSKQATVTVSDGSNSVTATCFATVGSAPVASATIDQSSLTASTGGKDTASVTITGSATNINVSNPTFAYLYIAIVRSSYSGATDIQTIGGQKGGADFLVGASSELVQNGRWSHTFGLFPGAYKVLVYDNYGSTMPLTTATLTVTAPYMSPSCTVTYSPSQVFPGQLFTLSWTSSGIAYASPNNATGPTIQTTNHNGTFGVILYGASGSQQYWDDKAETMSIQLGTGGVAGGPFVPLCTVSVPISSDGSNGAGTISGNTAQPNMGFNLHGTASNNGSNNLNVIILTGTYAGSRTWSVIQPLIVSGKDLPQQSTASVTNGYWTAAFSALPEGQYTVLVYDTTSGTPVLITSGGLYVTSKG